MIDVFPVNVDGAFIYNDPCPISQPIVSNGAGLSFHEDAVTNLAATRAFYELVVNADQKVDIVAEINNAFPMESNLMRDYLAARSPLSDDILKQAIDRNGLLDPWHLTQVLLTNSPLTKDVLIHLESSGILSPFFMSFLYQAQIPGASSYRKLLESEISYRESVRHDALLALLDFYNTHADQEDVTDGIKELMLADDGEQAMLWLLEHFISTGATVEAQEILSNMSNDTWMADFIALKQMQIELGNNWDMARADDIVSLNNWASNPKSSAYGQAYSVLISLDRTDDLPEPEIPFADRSGAYYQEKGKKDPYIPTLSAYPNPCTDHTFVTYPIEAEGIGHLQIVDTMGKLIVHHQLNGKGIIEMDTNHFSSGLYLLTIVVEGKTIVENKLVVGQ